MWNQPNPDTRPRRGNKTPPPQQDLCAFGYESLLFRQDEIASSIEQGHLLITWQGQDLHHEDSLWLDRYDARNLLDDFRLFTGPRDIQSPSFLDEKLYKDLDEERFRDLDSDEELLFDMDEDEREDHLTQKRRELEQSDFKGVHFQYGENKEEESSYRLHFEVPEGMEVPESEKVLALIERTAKFVNNSTEPTMEIILQAKQATNPNFAFMSRRHRLFQFYKHVRWLMQTGLYEYEHEVRQREVDEAKAEAEDAAAKEARILEQSTMPTGALHVNIKKTVEKTAEAVAGSGTPLFADKLLALNDERFGFLNATHPWHRYYLARLKDAQKELMVLDPACNVDHTALFLSEMENKDRVAGRDEGSTLDDAPGHVPSKDLRVTEMLRLDRLQRVKELFSRRRPFLKSPPSPTGADEQVCTVKNTLAGSRSRSGSRSSSGSRSRSRSSSRSESPSFGDPKRVRL